MRASHILWGPVISPPSPNVHPQMRAVTQMEQNYCALPPKSVVSQHKDGCTHTGCPTTNKGMHPPTGTRGHLRACQRWQCLWASDQQAGSVYEVGGERREKGGGRNPLISEEMSQIRFVNQKPIYNMQELICFIFLSYIFVKHI